jgi:hypothetical protein
MGFASSMVVAILLCASISVSVVYAGFSTAEASKAAYVYASLYGQLQDEVEAAEDVCDFLEELFEDAGYDSVVNAYCEGTVKDEILSNAENAEGNYTSVTVFHFGHMGYQPPDWPDPNVTCPCCYVDNNNETLYWWDIDDYTTQGKHCFAFMWVCFSADTDDLAEAWCHDLYDGGHCFLGFWHASPNLDGLSYTCYWGTGFVGKNVIAWIYYYALVDGYSIYDACDQMSYTLLGCGIESVSSLTNFITYWYYNPTYPDTPEGWGAGGLEMYGNLEDIYLT